MMRNGVGRWASRVAMLVLLLAAAGAGASEPPLSGQVRQFSFYETPVPAPETGFRDEAGNALSLADFRGRVVLLNLWATWCAPCVREMPSLDRLQAALGGEDFVVLALSSDRGGAGAVRPFFDRLGLARLGVYLDPGGAMPRALQVKGLPTTFLIDRDARLLGAYLGPAEWDSPEAIALIRHFIGGRPVPAPEPGLLRTGG
ncbi:MAG: hypothetical protein OHK0024_14550 [Thalassobaculales bacterium]